MSELKWFSTKKCEFPDIEECRKYAHVWLFYQGSVEHAFYANPEMNVSYFEDLDDERLDDASIWAEFITPDEPKF